MISQTANEYTKEVKLNQLQGKTFLSIGGLVGDVDLYSEVEQEKCRGLSC